MDMGTQSAEQLVTRNIPFDSINGVFITHMHADHSNGLLSFVHLCNWPYLSADPCICLPGDVEEIKDAIAAWLRCNHCGTRPLRYMQVTEGNIYNDGVISLTAFRTKHLDYSYAFLLEAEGKRVFFSGDLCNKGPQEDFPVSVLNAPLDLAICECAHFSADKYLPFFEGNENLKRLCITHYQDIYLPSILSLGKSLPGVAVFRAQDGMEIEL